MANKEKQLSKWQKSLTDLGLIKSDDKVEEYTTASWAEASFGLIASWRRGTLIFTKQKIVFMTTFGVSQLSIEYSDIREVKKNFAGFLPMGMKIMAYNKKSDKVKGYKFWLAGRRKWIEKIAEKAGIAR